MNKLGTSLTGTAMIIIATLIWGVGYSVKAAGMDYVGPFTFNAARFFIGGCATILPALYFIMQQRKKSKDTYSPTTINRGTIIAGVVCGAVLSVAINLQQFGLFLTTIAKSSFLTTLYVIIVPIIALIVLKKQSSKSIWIGAGVAMVGVFFLSVGMELSINLGDILTIFAALGFAIHILVIGCFSPSHNVLVLACIQFFVVFVFSLLMAIIFESWYFFDLVGALPYVLYAGVLATGIAFVLQMKAQKTTNPTVTAVLFSFEGVIATLAGWIILSQTLSHGEILGCILIFGAIVYVKVARGSAE